MSNALKVASGMGSGAAATNYVDDNFSAFTYTGNGSTQTINNGINLQGTLTAIGTDILSKFSTTLYTGNGSTQTITNGIDLAGSGGLVWVKSRSSASYGNEFQDTARGASVVLESQTAAAQVNYSGNSISSFTSSGFALGTTADTNANTVTFVSWTFKKAPKFFDVVTYTGNGTTQNIAHSLGQEVGMIIVKRTDSVESWCVYSRSLANTQIMELEATSAVQTSTTAWNSTTPTSSVFTVGTSARTNANTGTYVAYLFAHDSATDGIVQCGSAAIDSNTVGSVTLGWEPQFVLVKTTSSGHIGTNVMSWHMLDSTRGMQAYGSTAKLYADLSNSEVTGYSITPNATGFDINLGGGAAGNVIYMAIRKPEYTGGGGLVWTKQRSQASSHQLSDTVRGVGSTLFTNLTTISSSVPQGVTSFNANGYSLGTDTSHNQSAQTHVSWTFKKAPKFFDVVTYTGNGVAGRTIAHSLGVAPGMIMIKRTDGVGNWVVYHRTFNLATESYIYLNTTAASNTGVSFFKATHPTSSVFTLGSDGVTGTYTNLNAETYVAYLFAHDATADGIIQCGGGTTDASGNATLNLGWEPQFVLIKNTDFAQNWQIYDTSRGFSVGSVSAVLLPNMNAAEGNLSSQGYPTATGCYLNGYMGVSKPFIYLAIRRPNKPPTTGAQVYNAIARTGTGAAATVTGVGFAPDFVLSMNQSGASGAKGFFDKLRGSNALIRPNLSNAEDSTTSLAQLMSFDSDGFSVGADATFGTINKAAGYSTHSFKRAPGVFDIVCYTGTGADPQTVSHNLGVAPELMIFKARDVAAGWRVWGGNMAITGYLALSETSAVVGSSTFFGSTLPIATAFYVGSGLSISARTHVAYLFATKAGISKVFSFTGNGTSQTIDCGFTTGARFVLIKATSTTGSWLVADTARNIIAGNDPYLALNSTAAEVTSEDWIDPASSGFIVNEVAGSNANTNGVTYIGLAYA
jgi:hypothetical protein